MANASNAARKRGQHGPQPLSRACRRLLEAMLLAKAEAGDVAAAEALVRLSLQHEARTRADKPGVAENAA